MISAIVGGLGSGKSLSCMEMMERTVVRRRRIATNIALKEACWFQKNVVYFDEPKINGKWFFNYFGPGWTYFIDEASLWWDAQDWASVKPEVRAYPKMVRKRGDELVLIDQSLDNIYSRIRKLVQYVVFCDNVMRSSPWARFVGSLLPGFIRSDFSCFVRVYFSGWKMLPASITHSEVIPERSLRRFYDWYDTTQILGMSST